MAVETVQNSYTHAGIRTATFVLLLPVLVLMVSCNKPIACLPEEMARQPVNRSLAGQAGEEVNVVSIYLDVSTSMQGYVNPPKKSQLDNRKLPNLIRDLPSIATKTTDDIHYYFMGSRIRKQKGKEFMDAVNPGPYWNPTTNLVEVLKTIRESDRKVLSVLVTDLIPDTQEDKTGSGSRVWKLMGEVVKQGRCLSLIGVRALFNGLMYFPPDQKVPHYQGDRPLFVVVIGLESAVRNFTRELKERAFKGMVRDHLVTLFASGRWSLGFSDIDGSWASSSKISRHNVRPAKGSVLAPELRHEVLEEVITDDDAYLEVSLPLSELYPAYDVEFQPSGRELSTKLWSDHSDLGQTKCQENWMPEILPADLRIARLTKDGKVLIFRDKRLVQRLSKGRPYALEVNVFVKPPSEMDIPDWMKKGNGWSCDPSDLPRLTAEKLDFFPVPNLQSLGKMLAKQVGQAAQQQDIARIRVIFVRE